MGDIAHTGPVLSASFRMARNIPTASTVKMRRRLMSYRPSSLRRLASNSSAVSSLAA